MSKQRFSVPHRHAIWEAHGFKCFYCNSPLKWDQLEIDHLVPESLTDDKNQLYPTLDALGLPRDWDLNANHNLAPADRACNGRKRDLIGTKNQTIILLSQIASKVAQVEVLNEKYEKQSKSDIARAKLEAAVATGLIDESSLKKLVSTAATAGKSSIQMTEGLEFLDSLVINELSPQEVEPLLDMPIRLGADLPDGLDLRHHSKSVIYVKTCREYEAAIKDGYYAETTFGMSMEMWFQRASGILRALQACRPSVQSFMDTPRVGLCDIDCFPSDILPWMGDSGSPRHVVVVEFPTVGGLVANGHAEIVGIGSRDLHLKFQGLDIWYREVLRADLDGDGIEDILIYGGVHAIGGSLRFGIQPFAFSVQPGSGLFVERKILPPRSNESKQT